MTKRVAYVLGWVYGRLSEALGGQTEYDPKGSKFSQACSYPMLGFAAIHRDAMREGRITDALSREIAAALEEIDAAEMEQESQYLPVDRQGSWQLGYYKAKGGKPLPPPPEE